MTGTGPLASSGRISVNEMLTEMSGQAALSTRPTSRLVTFGTVGAGPRPPNPRPPAGAAFAGATSHVTLGTSLGTRPYTSASKYSTISGRRSVHQASGVVTGLRALVTIISGRWGQGLALASSVFW